MKVWMIALASTALAACAQAGKPAPAPGARQQLEILQTDAGGAFTAPVGETIRVRLESVPTAGYIWRLASPLPDFLVPAGEETLPTTPEQREPGFAGGNHWLVFAYTVARPGRGELVFHEGRPWELEQGAKPTDVFRVKIEGQANPE